MSGLLVVAGARSKKNREKTDQVYFKKIAGVYPVLILTSRYCIKKGLLGHHV
jgi:hypothetical protein